MTSLDITTNRATRKYPRYIMAARLCWYLGKILFRCSPRPCFSFRRWLLRRFGASVGRGVHIYASTSIYYPWNLEIGDYAAIGEHALVYNLGPVCIGNRTTISQRVHLCAGSHDYEDSTMPLLTLPIEIGNDAWICADAFVGPGAEVGDGAVVGARAVVTKNVAPWTVVAGNPAIRIKMRKLKNNQK